ncbi:type VI secretion protein [Alcaligenes faecalis]|nr:type VI secretion protein [Alcaligenes faecalis]
MSTLISPITRRRIAAFSLAIFPTAAWMTAATWASQMHWRDWNARTFRHFVMLTPQYPLLYGALGVGLVLSLVLILFIGRTARTEGFGGAAYKRFVRGTRTTSAKNLARQCEERGKMQIDVGGIPMPTANENLHLLISGATGSGKSVLLRNMAASVLKRSQHDMARQLPGKTPARNDRMIVIDPNGDLLSKFWQPNDVILNPYDARSQGWSFFNEVRADYDWKRLAHSMVPMSQDRNAEEWNDFGRLLLRETAKKLYELQGEEASIMDLFRLCTIEDPKVLKQFLEGTLAESLFVGSSEASKALSSARFVLSNKLSEHTGMKPGKFSIRDWLEKPDGGNLYINWREDMMSSMKPLVSSWADVFITSILSMPESAHRRWWLFIDELASLEALPSLEAGLTKGRKNGLRVVAGLQSTSQLEHIYGRTMATTIRASFRNLAVLGGSRTDPQTAKDMSESVGKHEVERPKFSISRSADNRNTSDNMERVTEEVVTAAQIQALPTLAGYVALAGDYPVVRVSLLIRQLGSSEVAIQDSGKSMNIATSTAKPSNG